eukprot:CAMPEP_0194060494 /NCGR_PEP_ID=MMETSP0009_2-20130614/71915_1 /TAXON_ID=210454 /ORGANISM="Grammatophora oceanica, Strain CCMP 410" /LENGTH=59 /DNA_ID=CAMNT_0038711433 /DNA_START=29 /DNA_END=205 /DNA_ORIENTATION=-
MPESNILSSLSIETVELNPDFDDAIASALTSCASLRKFELDPGYGDAAGAAIDISALTN